MPQDISKCTIVRLCRERLMKCCEPLCSNLRIEDRHWHIRFIGPWIYVVTFIQIRFWPADKKGALNKNMHISSSKYAKLSQ